VNLRSGRVNRPGAGNEEKRFHTQSAFHCGRFKEKAIFIPEGTGKRIHYTLKVTQK
jgi:predicted NodU family carbamoyl transferase